MSARAADDRPTGSPLQSVVAFVRARAASDIARGSLLLLTSTMLVNVGNYLGNLILGRWLGPSAFADLSFVVTLMLVLMPLSVALQTVTAKLTAGYVAVGHLARGAALHAWLGRRAWAIGVVLLLAAAAGAPLLQEWFHTASLWPIVLFGLGMPLYLALSVDRGVLQGQMRFGRFAATFQVEMWVRLLGSLLFVAIGWSVTGAVGAIALSLLAAWLVGRAARGRERGVQPLEAEERARALTFGIPVAASLVGQVLISNSDLLIVKHFYAPDEAGLYAALVLVGRMVFFATWPVSTILLPVVAQRHEQGGQHRHMLGLALLAVGLVSGGAVLVTALLPDLIVSLLFGSAYAAVAPLLWLYAAATGLYALANIVITYQLSLGRGLGSGLAAAAGIAQVAALTLWHVSLEQVVVVQAALMVALLAAVLIWDAYLARTPAPAPSSPAREPAV